MKNRICPLCRHTISKSKFNVDNFRIVSCAQCGFVYLKNPIPADEEEQNYENYFLSAEFADYTGSSSDENIRRAWTMNEQRIAWIKNFANTGKILDIGCGRGFFLQHAREAGFDVQGVEISRLAARYASERFDIPVHICNLEDEKSLQDSYDIVTMWHVLEHYRNPRAAMENVWSLLNPNGRLFVQVPNLNSLKFRLLSPSKKWSGGNHPKYHRSFFSKKSLDHLLKICGFSKILDSHNVYRHEKDPVYLIKRILNTFHWDSFLDITAVK